MKPGLLVVGLELSGTGAQVAHEVEPDDREPRLPDALQPASHEVALLRLGLTLRAQLGLAEDWAVYGALPIGLFVLGAAFADRGGAPLDIESIHHRDESIFGVGDVELGARFVAAREPVSLELLAGARLPFGDVPEDPYALGRAGLSHQHQFFGSGTVDPIVALELSWPLDPIELSAWSRAELPLYVGPKGYRASRVLEGGLAVGTALGLDAWSFRLGPELRWESVAEWGQRYAENSGRVEAHAALSALYRAAQGTAVYAALRVALWSEAVGAQLWQPIELSVGMRWAVDR